MENIQLPASSVGCPGWKPGGYYTIKHYLSDASLASRRGRSHLAPDSANLQEQEDVVDNMHDLNAEKNTDNANTVSDGYNVCIELGAHLALPMLVHRSSSTTCSI